MQVTICTGGVRLVELEIPPHAEQSMHSVSSWLSENKDHAEAIYVYVYIYI